MKFPLGAMSVGDILDRSLKLLLHRLWTFYAISLIVYAPVLLLQLALPALEMANPGDRSTVLAAENAGNFLVLLLRLILTPIATAATLHVIAQEFVDNQVGIGAAFAFAFRRFWALLGVSIVVGFLATTGCCLCVVPGIFVMIWYIFVAQVVVVEGLGTAALARSMELTKGFRWRILGVGILLIVINLGFGVVANVLEQILPSRELVPTQFGPINIPVPLGGVIYPHYLVNMVFLYLVQIVVQSYAAVCWTLFYFDLRIRKEGFDIELAARGQSPPELLAPDEGGGEEE